MVSGTKFYIFGGGRWREVDINDGCVEKWGQARFAYPKRGKIRLAKTGAVLAGLRDLVAGKRSTVKDGAHMPYKKIERVTKDVKNLSNAQLSNNNNYGLHQSAKSKSKISVENQCLPKTDACIQTSFPSQTLTFPQNFNEPRLRQRATSTTDEEMPSKITTTAIVHTTSAKHVQNKKRCINISSEENDVGTQKKRIPSIKLNKADSEKYNIYQRKRSNSSESVVWVVLPKKSQDDKLNSKETEIVNSNQLAKKNGNDSQKMQQECKEISNKQINENSSSTKQKVDEVIATITDNRDIGNREPDSNVVNKRQDQCSELIIDEKDVEIFRRYLIKHAKKFNLIKFDEDDDYKRRFFFKINPLVRLERSQKISKMLTKDSQNGISLDDFVNQLGLRSVSEPSVTKKYRTRKKTLTDKTDNSDSDDTDNKSLESRHKSNKIDKQTHKRPNRYKSSSSDYDTETESSCKHDSRLSRKYEKLNAVSNEKSKRYITRRSSVNVNKKTRSGDSKEVFSKHRNTELSTEEESRRPVTRSKRRTGESAIFDLTLTSEDESDNAAVKRSNNRTKSIDVTESSDSEVDKTKSSKRRKKRFYDKNNANKKGFNEPQHSTDDESNSIKEVNIRTKGKIDKKTLKPNDERSGVEQVKEKAQNKTKIHKSSKLTDDESSELVKKTKGLNRKTQTEVTKTNSNTNKYSEKESNSESSDDEAKIIENKRRYKKIKGKIISDTDEDNSKTFKTNRRDRNKEGTNKLKKGNNADSVERLSKERGKKIDKDNKIERSNIDSDDEIISDNRETKNIKNSSNKEQNVTNAVKTQKIKAKSTETDKIKSKKVSEVASIVKNTQARHTISKRPSSSVLQSREYSNLEDHAIVAFVSTGGRARCVNGNRIWIELQERYHGITGLTRTWHSLRNRYLRYILPKLGTMALPPTEEKRLRAAAATGEIKRKRERRNSIFGAPTQGALSRRPLRSRSSSEEHPPPPKKHRHDKNRKVTPPPSTKRVLRSSLPPSPATSPRYSDITRQFAAKHRRNESTPNSSPKPETKKNKTSIKDTALDSENEFSKKEKRSNKKKKVVSDKTVLESESEFSEEEQRISKKKKEVASKELTVLDSEIEFSENEQSNKNKNKVTIKRLTVLDRDSEFSQKEQRRNKKNKEVVKELGRSIKYKRGVSDRSIPLDSESEFSKKEPRRSRRGKDSSALESGDDISEQEKRSNKKRKEIASKELTALLKNGEFMKKEQRRNSRRRDSSALESGDDISEQEKRSSKKRKEASKELTALLKDGELSKKEQRRSSRRRDSSALESGDDISDQEKRSSKKRNEASKELTALLKDGELSKKEQRRSSRRRDSSALESGDDISEQEKRSSKKRKEIASKELTALSKDRESKKEQRRNRNGKEVASENSIALEDSEISNKEKRRSTRGKEVATEASASESAAKESDSEALKKEQRSNKNHKEVDSKELTELKKRGELKKEQRSGREDTGAMSEKSIILDDSENEFSIKERRNKRKKVKVSNALERESELLKKEQRKVRQHTTSSINAGSSQDSSPTRESIRNIGEEKPLVTERGKSRTRKLFNPNALL